MTIPTCPRPSRRSARHVVAPRSIAEQASDTPIRGGTAVYRLYDITGGLLYVGITDDPVARLAQHAEEKPWWWEVAVDGVVWYPSRAVAAVEEARAIIEEGPAFNVAGAPPYVSQLNDDRDVDKWLRELIPSPDNLNALFVAFVQAGELELYASARLPCDPYAGGQLYERLLARAGGIARILHRRFVRRWDRQQTALVRAWDGRQEAEKRLSKTRNAGIARRAAKVQTPN